MRVFNFFFEMSKLKYFTPNIRGNKNTIGPIHLSFIDEILKTKIDINIKKSDR